jgi:putative signal transducing protein
MAEELRERLLASYAGMGEAMVVQNVLEAGGVPCRLADLEQLPSHMLGMAGGLGRSVGLWVLEADVERATALLGTLAATGAGVDEEALEAEALAAAPAGGATREAARAAGPRAVRAARAPWIARAAIALAVAAAVLLASRGCG